MHEVFVERFSQIFEEGDEFIQVGPDRDGLELVELRFGPFDRYKDKDIVLTKEAAIKLAEEILFLYK